MIVLLASVVVLGLLGALLAHAGRAAEESRATTLVRAGLGSFAALVLAQEALGATGHAGPRATLLGLVVALVGVGAATRGRWLPTPVARAAWTPLEAGLLVALVGALLERASAGLDRRTFLYDTLSYHLHAPATWMHDGRLTLVPAVFGDGSPAYAPANVELLFWFLMAPLRSDFLAQEGQLPLAALAVVAIVAAARELGAPRGPALAAALAFLLVPEVWSQAATAMVDVGMAAFFLAALPFMERLRRGARVADAVALGLAVGLCAGTKVAGLVFVAPLVAAALPGLTRAPRPALAAAGAALATGGFFYARNLVVTGNPFFPLRLGPLPGLVDGAAVRASDYHLPISDVRALGGLLLEGGAAFWLAIAVALLRARHREWAMLAAVLVALFWLVVPYQETRFLFPVFGVLAVGLATVRDETPRRWLAPALAIGGGLLAAPAAAPWGAVAVGAVAAAGLSWARAHVRPRFWLPSAALTCAALASGVRDELRAYRARDPGYSVGDDLAAAWSWTRVQARGARVAYTGNNLPFPLAGQELANDVRYVNVAGAPGDLLHDFARRASPPAVPTPEPAPYRDGASYERWRQNLGTTRRELLFVAALYPEVQRTIAHDAEGFPVERAWADAHPESFTLRFASAAARVYGVTP